MPGAAGASAEATARYNRRVVVALDMFSASLPQLAAAPLSVPVLRALFPLDLSDDAEMDNADVVPEGGGGAVVVEVPGTATAVTT